MVQNRFNVSNIVIINLRFKKYIPCAAIMLEQCSTYPNCKFALNAYTQTVFLLRLTITFRNPLNHFFNVIQYKTNMLLVFIFAIATNPLVLSSFILRQHVGNNSN